MIGQWWSRFRQRGSARESQPQAPEAQRRAERVAAAAEERERIYSDLHDDIGAKLLTLVHTAENPAQADLARSVLQDLRDIVSRARGAEGTLLEVLAQIRDETEQRLALMKSALAWEQPADMPDPMLDEGQALHLFRIVREAVSNAIRHGHATQVRVRVRQQSRTLVLEVADDGPGVAAQEGGGRGMENMKARAAELHGTIQWNPATLGGTKVVLQFPLPP